MKKLALFVMVIAAGCATHSRIRGNDPRLVHLHQDCKVDADCDSGLLCLPWSERLACEIPCATRLARPAGFSYDTDCPAPLRCIGVAVDGPSYTCQ